MFHFILCCYLSNQVVQCHHAHLIVTAMSHREEPEETRSKVPPPQPTRQPNSTPVEGSRSRWRPCQLNSQDEQGNAHHRHYHRASHQEQPGTNRAPQRRSRRHAPSHAQRGSSESVDAEPHPGQQPRPGGSRYRRNVNREHQHKHRQQPRASREVSAQHLDAPEINPAMDTLSPEESSQELQTPSSQEDLTPSKEEPNPSPQEVPIVEQQDGGSPGLHCSSSTESSLHAHSEQIEDQHGAREQTVECKGGIDAWDVGGSEDKRNDGAESYKEAKQEEHVQLEKDSMANAGSSKGSKKISRRSGPIRVDVPPFAEFPRKPLTVPNFQPQPFSEPLRGYHMELNSGSVHLSSTSCSPVGTDMRPEGQSGAQSCEETFPDTSSEACSSPYPSVSESCPKFYPVTQSESDRELYHLPQTGWYQEHSEEQQSFEINHDTSSSEAIPQNSLHEELRSQGSVGSRLHHYDEHSGDEASSPDRGRSKFWRRSVAQECSELRREQCQGHPHLPVLDTEEKPEHDSVEDRPHAAQESANLPGDVISLAIKDIKEAIEEVKTKTVRSPYTPDKPTEPVWVMRRDVSPVEEHNIHSPPQSPPQLNSPQNTVSF